jgi:hypothetical protein
LLDAYAFGDFPAEVFVHVHPIFDDTRLRKGPIPVQSTANLDTYIY